MPKLELKDLTNNEMDEALEALHPDPCVKKWYRSKTVWLNVATVVAGSAPLVGNFVGLVSPLTYAILMTAVGVGNIALRFLTDQGIE